MGDGYVGTAQDAVRIRRLEKQREAERRKIQELKTKSSSAKGQTGLLQFGSSTSEVHAYLMFSSYNFIYVFFFFSSRVSFSLLRKIWMEITILQGFTYVCTSFHSLLLFITTWFGWFEYGENGERYFRWTKCSNFYFFINQLIS